MLLIGLVTVIVTVAVLALWYMIYLSKCIARVRKETLMPLRDWLALYEAADEVTRPIMAFALISRACEVGAQLRVMNVEQGRLIISEAKYYDYTFFLDVLLCQIDHYPVDLSSTDEPALETILALLVYSSDVLNAE